MKSLSCIFIFSWLLFPVFEGFGQEIKATITGSVSSHSGLPLPSATVSILRSTDSSVLETIATDRRGKFNFKQFGYGSYILRVSFVNYETYYKSFEVDMQRTELELVLLQPFPKNLGEIVVTGRRPLQTAFIDKKVYNVSQDLMAQNSSASDVLRNIPSVEVDLDGQVSLRGSGNMKILVNGRPSLLVGRSGADVLQQLPANFIERIEVMTNPSAKFEPDGTSGIINIILKKNAQPGWNATLTANAGSGSRYNTGVSFNYKPGKLNLFATYNYRHDRRYRMNEVARGFYDDYGVTDSFYNEYSQIISKPNSHLIHTGADFFADTHNEFGISGNFFERKMSSNETSQRSFFNKDYLLTGRLDRLRFEPEKETEKEANAYWQHKFKGEDHELRTELLVSSADDNEVNQYTNRYYQPPLPDEFENTLVSEKENQQEFTMDYTRTAGEEALLETGLEMSFYALDLDFRNEYFDPALQQFVTDAETSNRFKYRENIHAIYATYERSFGDLGMKAGLRAEQAFLDGNLVTKDSIFDNNYFRVYPSLHFSWQLKKGEVQLNYSKRVNRPDGDELNPFPEYQDPYNLRAGNPGLLPEFIHSFELGYKTENNRFSFVPSVYYRYRKNGFTSVTKPLNDSVLLTTEENLAKDHTAGLELIFSARAAKIFSANLSSNFFYNRIDASNLLNTTNRDIISMSTNFNANFSVTPHTLLQVTSNYRSARLTAQGKSYARFVLNTGIRQDLFRKKLSLVFTVSDVFKSQRQKNELNSPFFNQVSIGRRDQRIFFLGFSYRLGGLKQKNGETELEFDDTL